MVPRSSGRKPSISYYFILKSTLKNLFAELGLRLISSGRYKWREKSFFLGTTGGRNIFGYKEIPFRECSGPCWCFQAFHLRKCQWDFYANIKLGISFLCITRDAGYSFMFVIHWGQWTLHDSVFPKMQIYNCIFCILQYFNQKL